MTVKRKLLSIISLVMLLTCVFAFSSCFDENADEYTLTYTVDGEVYHTQKIKSAEDIVLPKNPTKEGYIFDGWYLDNLTWNEDFTVEYKLSGDITLYAKFKEGNATAGGGSAGSGEEQNPPSIAPHTEELSYKLINDGTAYEVVGVADESVTEIVIPTTYKDLPVTSIGERAFLGCTSLENITIPESVTSIRGDAAFANCTSLESITIPESVTSIGNFAFYGCSSLTSITIPSNVTSIGSSAFEGCYKLVEVYNKSSLNIEKDPRDNRYVGYYALNIYTPKSGSAGIFETMNDKFVFYSYGNDNYLIKYLDCETSITLPESYNGESYKINQYAFYKNTTLESITIPSSVTSIGDAAFDGCTSLNAVHISSIENWLKISFDNISANPLYYAGNLYLNGNLLTELTVPNTITEINSYAFYGCSSLESITIPSSVTSIGYDAFCGCTNLTIYCEAESQPSGWDSYWNYNGGTVVWGHKQSE